MLGIRGGYLDPHPLICFLKLNNYHMLSKTVAIFHVFIVIKLIQLVWIKKLFSHVWLANRGRGQDTPARVSWPPPTYLFLQAQKIAYAIKNCCSISCYSCNRINSIGLNKQIFSHIWLGIRGGGQDTPAAVSWPPTSYLFLNAQQIPYAVKNCCSISCYSCNRINSIGLNKKNFFHIFGLESGMGVKIPKPAYLDPHPVICF